MRWIREAPVAPQVSVIVWFSARPLESGSFVLGQVNKPWQFVAELITFVHVFAVEAGVKYKNNCKAKGLFSPSDSSEWPAEDKSYEANCSGLNINKDATKADGSFKSSCLNETCSLFRLIK